MKIILFKRQLSLHTLSMYIVFSSLSFWQKLLHKCDNLTLYLETGMHLCLIFTWWYILNTLLRRKSHILSLSCVHIYFLIRIYGLPVLSITYRLKNKQWYAQMCIKNMASFLLFYINAIFLCIPFLHIIVDFQAFYILTKT